MTAKKRKEYLESHPYKLYQGKDGRWFSRFPKKEGGSVQKAFRTRKEAEDYICKFYEDESNKAKTIREVFEEAIRRKLDEGSISESSATTYRVIFKRHFYEFGDIKIGSVTKDTLTEFIREQKIVNDLGSNGYANLIRVVRIIFKHAKKSGLISFSVSDALSEIEWGRNAFRKLREDDSEVFDDAEMAKLSLYFKENEDVRHLGLLLLFITGLRIGELAALKWEDIGEESLFIHRTEVYWVDTDHKTHCEVSDFPKSDAGIRFVPLPAQGRWIIERLRDGNADLSNYIFMKRGKRVRASAFRRALDVACKKCNIPHKSPHKIRKTYASILLDSGVATKVITDSMGHTDIATTNNSYARKRKTVGQVAEALKGIDEFDLIGL